MTAPDIPVFRASFTLTRADALAWETRPRDLSPREKLALFSLIALGAATYGATEDALPVWFLLLPSLVQFPLLLGAGYALWRLGLILAARQRAAHRVPQPLPCVFEDWGDHFSLRQGDQTRRIARETLLAVTTPGDLVVLATPDDPVILPLRAFSDPATARALAKAWQRQVDLAARPD